MERNIPGVGLFQHPRFHRHALQAGASQNCTIQSRVLEHSLRQIAVEQLCLPDAAAHKRTASEHSLICTEAVQTAVDELRSLKIRKAHTGSLHLGLFEDRIPEDGIAGSFPMSQLFT